MKDRKGEIGRALAETTIQYVPEGRGFVRWITEEFDLASHVEEIVMTMAMVAGSTGDLFKIKATTKLPRIGITKLGARFLRCVTNIDVQQIRRHFPKHRFNPLFELFDRYTISLGAAATMTGDADVEVCNACISGIQTAARSKYFRKILNDHDRSARKNHASLTTYARKLCSIYPRLFGLRIDLGYHAQSWWSLNDEQLIAHREKFLLNLGKMLKVGPLVGYAWKVEFVHHKYFHIHLLIFVDGEFLNEGVEVFTELKRYWEEIATSGKGLLVDCSKNRDQYAGVDIVAERNQAARDSLREAIIYMTMTDRYIKIKVSDRHRVFGKGAVPKKKVLNRGKPVLKQFIHGVDSPPKRQEQFIPGVDSPPARHEQFIPGVDSPYT